MMRNGQTGECLPLRCSYHKEKVSFVKLPEEFINLTPRGGCAQVCGYELNCGHVCVDICHPYTDLKVHDHENCTKPCLKTCKLMHPCRENCCVACGPCTIRVDKRMPKCGHEQSVPCFELDSWLCRVSCTEILTCGHQCQGTCGQCEDKCVSCQVIVERVVPSCGHLVDAKCYEDPSKITCKTMTTIVRFHCGHEERDLCYKRSLIEQSLCKVQVEKPGKSCKHLVKVPCHQTPDINDCKEICGEILPCSHPCKGRCNVCRSPRNVRFSFLRESDKLEPKHKECTEKCEAKKACGHQCTGTCTSCKNGCIQCLEIVKKIIPSCGHDVSAKCSADLSQILCRVMTTIIRPECGHEEQDLCYKKSRIDQLSLCKVQVEKPGSSCKHLVKVPCYQTPKITDCKAICGEILPCSHLCQKNCSQCQSTQKFSQFKVSHSRKIEIKHAICKLRCTAKLNCGHQCHGSCEQCKNGCIRCSEIVEKIIPLCGHKVLTNCFEDPGHIECHELIKFTRIKCGHDEVSLCCKRTEIEQHRCEVIVEKPGACCSHKVRVACYLTPTVDNCIDTCGEILPCSHRCRGKCYRCQTSQHSPCKEFVKKTLECGHEEDVICSNFHSVECSQKCGAALPCGHQCMGQCVACAASGSHQDCLYEKIRDLPCGHLVTLPCNHKNETMLCSLPCKKMLNCQHPCPGKCGLCQQRNEHLPCSALCGKRLDCGHKCRAACGDMCPPCTARCRRRCRHNACREPCHALCGIPPCIVPCRQKTRGCGHACATLCGEICFCRECNRSSIHVNIIPPLIEKMRKMSLSEMTKEKANMDENVDESYETALQSLNIPGRLLDIATHKKLTDVLYRLYYCRHIFPVNDFDDYVEMCRKENVLPTCPKCRKQIFYDVRFGNQIKRIREYRQSEKIENSHSLEQTHKEEKSMSFTECNNSETECKTDVSETELAMNNDSPRDMICNYSLQRFYSVDHIASDRHCKIRYKDDRERKPEGKPDKQKKKNLSLLQEKDKPYCLSSSPEILHFSDRKQNLMRLANTQCQETSLSDNKRYWQRSRNQTPWRFEKSMRGRGKVGGRLGQHQQRETPQSSEKDPGLPSYWRLPSGTSYPRPRVTTDDYSATELDYQSPPENYKSKAEMNDKLKYAVPGGLPYDYSQRGFSEGSSGRQRGKNYGRQPQSSRSLTQLNSSRESVGQDFESRYSERDQKK